MKFPNHLILDISKNHVSYSSQYWIYKYISTFKKNVIIFENFSFQRSFLFKKENLLLNKLIKNQKKYTIRYSLSNPAIFFSEKKKKLYKNLYAPRIKVKSKLLYSKHIGKEVYDYLTNSGNKFDEKFFKRIIKNLFFKKFNNEFRTNKLWNLFDINFLRKEKIYTKLKYSRVPQYDIVSGGVAALFAGFLGFLISEKFGFELGDSGDFYILFMYLVFFFFFSRLFLRLINSDSFSWNVFSFKWLFCFYRTILTLGINRVKSLINK